MPQATHVQTSFTAGELSPRLMGRTDLSRYQNGLDTADNCIIYPHGMISRRPGTKHISSTKGSSAARLIPFEYNDDQAYVVEFGDEYLRFYRDGLQITGDTTLSGASWSSEVATYTTSVNHTISVGDFVTVTGVVDTTSPTDSYNISGVVQSIPAANQFTLNLPGSNPGTYSSGGSVNHPYEIVAPWEDTDIDEISYVQSADILYAFHPNFAPRQIARTGADVFAVSTFEIQNGPFEPVSQTARLTVSASGHNATLVDSSYHSAWGGAAGDWAGDEPGEHMLITIIGSGYAWDHDGANGTTGQHIGRLIKFKWDSTDYYVGILYQTLSTTQAYMLVLEKGSNIVTTADINPSVVANDQWFLGDFYGSFEDTSHSRILIASASWAANVLTVNCARKHCLEVGDSVDIEGLESTTDVNGSYTVATVVDTDTITVAQNTDPGTITNDTGDVVDTPFMSNTSQEGTATDMNQPSIPAFYQQRMWLGKTTQNVNRIYASRTGDFANFQEASLLNSESYASLDTDALNLTIDDDQVNEIRWIRSVARGLVIGTNGAEYNITGTGTSSVITPSNVQAQRQTRYGSEANIRPELIGRSLLFVHRSGTRMMELAYSFEADQQTGTDLGLVSEHLLKAGVKDISYQEVPVQTLWVVMDDGSLVTLVYEKDQDVLGWTKGSFGGSGLAESVAVIPETDEDAVWFVVNRGGSRTIEVMQAPYDVDSVQKDAWYVDNGLDLDQTNTTSSALLSFTGTYTAGGSGTLAATAHTPFAGTTADVGDRYRLFDSAGNWYDLEITEEDTTSSCTARVITSGFPTELEATNTSSWAKLVSSVSGLEHLAGQTVKVFADGGTHEDVTVSATGTATLNGLYSFLKFGYGYTTTIKTLPIRVLQYFTETRGKAKALHNVEVQLWESLGGQVDFGETVTDIEYRQVGLALGKAPPFETGIVDMSPNSSYDTQAQARIVTDEPLPFNILSIVYEMDINAAV